MTEIYYDHVEKLGFERMDYTDNVVYKKCGHHPFHMSKELPGKIVIYWNSESYSCEMLRLDKKQNILGKKVIYDLFELVDLISFFGFKEDVEALTDYMNSTKSPLYA